MTEKEHMEDIATICREIEDDLIHIKFLSDYLKKIYGILICDTGIQINCHVQVYSGIELIERALKKIANENKESAFECVKKQLYDRNIEWFQLPDYTKTKYKEANYYGDAVIDLRKERSEHGNHH